MSRILVRVDSPSLSKKIWEVLIEKKYEVITAQGLETDSLSPAEIVDTVSSEDPGLVILDFVPADALSIKIVQKARDISPFLKFIFIIPEGLETKYIIMAMNEGASALLPVAFNKEALLNYVSRAQGARRQEMEYAAEVDRCRDLAEREKNCAMERSTEISKNKRRLNLAYRLINHLLANSRPAGKRWKILLVSDSTFQVDRVRQALENLNFEVATAPNGKAGLETALKVHPRIIVSDLEMPECNGLELCRAVKNQEKLAPNYFIISTANSDRMEEVLKPENKVDDVLIKPSREEEFQEFTARIAMGLIV